MSKYDVPDYFSQGRRGVQDAIMRYEEAKEKRETKPTRLKKAEKERLEYERDINLKEALDKEAMLKTEEAISKAEATIRRKQVENAALATVGVSDEESFKAFIKDHPESVLKDWDIDPKKSYEANIPAISRAQERGVYTIEHLQALDLERRKASKTKQPTWTSPTQGKPITGTALGQIGITMTTDPDFSHLYNMFTPAAESTEFGAAQNMVAQHIQTMVEQITLKNKQRAKLDPTAKPEGVDLNKVQSIAEERTKAYMFDSIDSKLFGEKYIKYKSMSEATEEEEVYIQRMATEYIKDPKYFKLYNENPTQFREFMRKQYLIHKMTSYRNAKERLYGGINSSTQ